MLTSDLSLLSSVASSDTAMISCYNFTVLESWLLSAQLWPIEAAGKIPSQHYLLGPDNQHKHQHFSEIDDDDDTYV